MKELDNIYCECCLKPKEESELIATKDWRGIDRKICEECYQEESPVEEDYDGYLDGVADDMRMEEKARERENKANK